MIPDYVMKKIKGFFRNIEITNAYLTVDTPELLTQVIGFMKYISYGDVYFRGQTHRYIDKDTRDDLLIPSLFRKDMKYDPHAVNRRMNKLKELCAKITEEGKNIFLNETPPSTYCPILQQYGMDTEWLDLVDNIWVALWFSAYKTIVCKCSVAECTKNSMIFWRFRESDELYSYIYLLEFKKLKKKGKGIYIETIDKGAMEIIDLRQAAPSLYLRPHVQHGIMARRKDFSEKKKDIHPYNYSDHIMLTLRIKTKDVLSWIGNSYLLKSSFFFPSPLFDEGYKLLLWQSNLYHSDKCRFAHISD